MAEPLPPLPPREADLRHVEPRPLVVGVERRRPLEGRRCGLPVSQLPFDAAQNDPGGWVLRRVTNHVAQHVPRFLPTPQTVQGLPDVGLHELRVGSIGQGEAVAGQGAVPAAFGFRQLAVSYLTLPFGGRLRPEPALFSQSLLPRPPRPGEGSLVAVGPRQGGVKAGIVRLAPHRLFQIGEGLVYQPQADASPTRIVVCVCRMVRARLDLLADGQRRPRHPRLVQFVGFVQSEHRAGTGACPYGWQW